MEKLVLLVCGTGASSGFMAGNARKAAKKANKNIRFIARSDAEIKDHIDELDLLMVGPHLKYMIKELEDLVASHSIPVGLIDQVTYGTLNGEKLLKEAEELLEGGNN